MRGKFKYAAAAAGIIVVLAGASTGAATPGGLATADMNHGANAVAMVNALVGNNASLSVSNVHYTGNVRAAGTFSNGTAPIGFANGIVLGSGHIQTVAGDTSSNVQDCSKGVEGPNQCKETFGSRASWSYNAAGDSQLDALINGLTRDASVLTFDFTPQYPTIQFRYVFGSDEYSEWSNSPYNDVFGFFVNGQNCALVPGTTEPVSINSINNGSTVVGGDPTPHHANLFRDNVRPTSTIDTELDGLTTVLTCSANVNPGVVNHLKLAIADAGDTIIDSTVFIQAGSLISGTQLTTTLHGNGQSGATISVPAGEPAFDSAALTGANASAATGSIAYTVYSDATCTTAVANGGTKTITGGVVPDSDPVSLATPGTYYWQASYDGDLGNNAVKSTCGDETEVVTVPARTVSVTGGTATEGGSITFDVTLDQPAVVPVDVDYATSDGTATASADYTAASGTVHFAAGDSSQTVTVATADDALDETSETMTLTLSNPQNASIGSGSATGTIDDNDPQPALSISDETYLEGDSGTVNEFFTVSLSAPSGLDVTFDYASANGTAQAGSDYVAASGTVTIPAGQTSAHVFVQVMGDTAFESTETFTVNLSNAANATFAKSVGVGTITDDDNQPPTCNAASVTPTTLWPPNGKFVTVTVGGCTDPDHDTLTYSIVKVEQDEARGGDVDAKRVAGHPNQVQLRAERLGTGNGRVYFITFTVTDGHSESITKTVKVTVAHDEARGAIDSGPRINSGL